MDMVVQICTSIPEVLKREGIEILIFSPFQMCYIANDPGQPKNISENNSTGVAEMKWPQDRRQWAQCTGP